MGSRGNVAEDKNVSSKVIRKKVNNTVSIALKRYKIDSYILLDLDKVSLKRAARSLRRMGLL